MNLTLERRPRLTEAGVLYSVGIALILVGISIIVLAVIVLSMRSAGKSKIRGGGAVIIGPIPIIFGTDKKSLKTIVSLSLALAILLIIVLVIRYWLFE
jgi:uncharacterized protein (TIGR00304 family)